MNLEKHAKIFQTASLLAELLRTCPEYTHYIQAREPGSACFRTRLISVFLWNCAKSSLLWQMSQDWRRPGSLTPSKSLWMIC